MDIVVPTIDEMAVGIKRGVAAAVKDAHARGLPVFVSDEATIYAIYPDGRRVAVEHLPAQNAE
jgi:hypothetical protein